MLKLIVIMVLSAFSVVASASTTSYAGGVGHQTESMPVQFDDWHYAGLRWFEVGDNLVFIFPARDFYHRVNGHIQLRHQAILLGLATWLKTIPKTWVRFTGIRCSHDKTSLRREALQDAHVLASYFWDADIDTRGIYTNGLTQIGDSKQGCLSRVEMVVSVLPQGSVLM